MYFDYIKFVAFDVFILRRPNAKKDYEQKILDKAKSLYDSMSADEAEKLAHNIIVYTQGFIHGSLDGGEKNYKEKFLDLLLAYDDIDKEQLRRNLKSFHDDIIPEAERLGIRMCIHPDDPPYPVLGLPRIVSTFDDLEWIFRQHSSLANGLTFCSGSFSVREDNNLEEILSAFANRVHFLHLRNNALSGRDFYESGHIDGVANLSSLIKIALEEQLKRKENGRDDYRIPVRPDHGIKMLDDFDRNSPPGYPVIGRLVGLKEITGIEAGISHFLGKRAESKTAKAQRR
jgi:mannonate dehydratase